MPGFSVFRPCSPVSVGLAALCLTPFPAAAQMQTIASLPAPMQTGIAVSASGRLFTNFPHWGDPVRFTVAEVKNGRVVPYPNAAINRLDKAHPSQCLVSMQSVVVAPNNRLWLLDTGSIKFTRVIPGGPKLVCVDLATNKIVKTISFPSDVALPMTYLNDIRFG